MAITNAVVPSIHYAKLRDKFPGCGMIYLSRYLVTHSSRRDKRIRAALKDTGYSHTKDSIRSAMVRMFEIATPIIVAGRAEKADLWDMLPDVQQQLDWARLLPESVFLELFARLVEARRAWELNPRSPFPHTQPNDALVDALIAFRRAVGDGIMDYDYTRKYTDDDIPSWILAHAMCYDLAGGLEAEEDEDEDVDMEREMEMGMGNHDEGNDRDGNSGDGNNIVMDVISPLENMTIDQKGDDGNDSDGTNGDNMVIGVIPPLENMNINEEEKEL
ncbi:hypothetical protein F5Y19DRAFT_46781 [Xylariaceae sp. FL1651]|nr:hypothetical protein F5Y19DRAFT_46781 [Xylariaceae sp. FL1651]